jgi:hypothetical protein
MPQTSSAPDVPVSYRPGSDAPYEGVEYSQASGWVAGVLLGGVLLVLLGTLHVGIGLVALFRPQALAASRAELLLSVGLTALAWIHIVLGAVAVTVGVGLVRGVTWARVAAILLACLAAVVNFAFIGVYPVWSITAIALTAIVIYSVAAHGSEVADAYGRR